MRPSPRPPPLDDIPSSPSSEWSYTHSRSPSSTTQDYLSPITPAESCFYPVPAIVTPDEFTLQLDAQFDKIVGRSSHKSTIAHLLPQTSVPSPDADPSFLSDNDASKAQVFLRNRDRWENMYDRLESSPPRPRNAPCVLPMRRESANDALTLEATHPALVDTNEPPDPSRYSLLIQEVSLLVGLTAEDDDLSPADYCPPVPDGPRRVPDILPLSIAPTKSLASRTHRRNASLPVPTDGDLQVDLPGIPISPTMSSHINDARATLRNDRHPLPRSRDLVTPVARYKDADAVRPPLSPRRRQGQVFHFESPHSNVYQRSPVDLDETFSHPRQPPPKPILNSPPNRCSSLDRLEYSLRKLEAHAPHNHRKSRSEGRSPDHVSQRKDKRPSLPPPRYLKKQPSIHEITRPAPSSPAVDNHFLVPAPPVSKSIPPRECVVPQACLPIPLHDEHREEDQTPGSFMDMDIPLAEVSPKRRTSLRQVTSREKMKSLVRAARRVSRGVIAWGKSLTGSAKSSTAAQETTIVESARV